MDSPTSGPSKRNPASPPNWRRINKKSSTTIFSSLARPTTPGSAKRKSRVGREGGWLRPSVNCKRLKSRLERVDNQMIVSLDYLACHLSIRRWRDDFRHHGSQKIPPVPRKGSLQSFHAGKNIQTVVQTMYLVRVASLDPLSFVMTQLANCSSSGQPRH